MKDFIKRHCSVIFLIMLMSVFVMTGMITWSKTSSMESAAESGNGPKLLYYVDAGNVVANSDGTGEKTDRGAGGYSSKIANGFMEKYGLSFGTSDGAGLYNSVTDKLYGVDDVTGKSWGFNEYEGWDWWRHGLTASKEAGFDSYRYINENSYEGILTYTFEVDDDTTELSLTFGTRTPSGWGEKPSQYRINGGDAIDYTAQESDEQITATTKGVEKDGAYFVTLEFGVDEKNAFVNWIMISTSDYTLPEEQTTYTFSKFAVKGETTVKAVSSDGDTVDATLDAENAQKIATADNFTSVTVKATIAEKLHENIPVTVLPKGTKKFVDIGGSGDGIHLLKDVAYNEELGYGYVSGYGTPGWVDDPYTSSIVWANGNDDTLEYRFDGLTEGDYGVIIGTDAKTWGDRTMSVSVNGSEEKELSVFKNNTASGTYYGQVADDGVLTVNVKGKGGSGYIVSYMLVYSLNKVTFESADGNEIKTVYFEDGTNANFNIAEIGTDCVGFVRDGGLYSTWEAAVTETATTVPVLTADISMQSGASIRLIDPTGLRFEAHVGEATYEALKDYNATYGILLLSNEKMNGELTLDSQDALNFAVDPALNNGIYKYRATVVDIPEDKYTVQVAGRAYVTVTLSDGTTRTVYSVFNSTENVRSIAQVAQNILDNDEAREQYADYISILKKYAGTVSED